jgi:hypothetical protein
MSEQKQMNKALFIVLLIVFFPAAIVYAVVCNKKPQEGPIDLSQKTGFVTSLVGASIWAVNGLYRLIQLSIKVDATSGFMFGLPGVIVGAALIALVLFGKNKKLFSIIYLVAIIALDVISLVIGFFGYYSIAIIGSIVGIFGGIRAIKYNAWLETKEN